MNLEELSQQANVLAIEELPQLSSLIEDGLRAVVLCQRGIARSWEAAQILTQLGYPAAAIEGGVAGISVLAEIERQQAMQTMGLAPHLAAILSVDEVREFQGELEELREATGRNVQLADTFCDIYCALKYGRPTIDG